MNEEKVLVKGNYAIAQAAINAGCQCYFGYPITPQTEIGEYLSGKMQELGRAYVCAESELGAINMVMGAVSTGVKAMTSSSSCAVALMQEALSYAASDELPVVLVNVMRTGPGLGYIYPAQGDYNQAVYGGGNGDYKIIVLAPSTVQECVDLTYRAFYLAQKYRNPVILLADGLLGQMMEPASFGEYPYPEVDVSSWALTGAKQREARSIYSCAREEKKQIQHIYDSLNSFRKEMVTPVFVSDEDFTANWKASEYTSLGFTPDCAEYYTDNGERVRSKSEIIIANKLYRYNIPYRYEYPLQLQSGIITHPDFTCLNVKTRQEYIWEHFGIMDNAEYACNAIKKISDYANSGYVLGRNFIATFETANTPINANCIDSLIKSHLC